VTQRTIDLLAKMLDRDDMIVDGGNTKWNDDKRRAATMKNSASTMWTWAHRETCGAWTPATA
jgi:6-phosphogluconate dehydrogenase (decarboxylating)